MSTHVPSGVSARGFPIHCNGRRRTCSGIAVGMDQAGAEGVVEFASGVTPPSARPMRSLVSHDAVPASRTAAAAAVARRAAVGLVIGTRSDHAVTARKTRSAISIADAGMFAPPKQPQEASVFPMWWPRIAANSASRAASG